MKQYLRFLSTSQINNSSIKDILTKRFPTCDVYLKNGTTYVRKNSIVTAKVKIEKKASAITVSLVPPWWVWFFVSWLIYAFYKRGFTDEVYSVLRKDLSTRFPNDFTHLCTATERANWKLKVKPLGPIGLLILGMFILGPIINFLINQYFDLTFEQGPILYNLVSVAPEAILWLALGYTFTQLPNFGKGKIGGILLEVRAVICLISCAVNIIYVINLFNFNSLLTIDRLNQVESINGILSPVILILAGFLINKAMKTGASRYFCIVTTSLGLLNIINILIFREFLIFNVSEDPNNHLRVIAFIWSLIYFICVAILYVFLIRSLYKMRKYPIEKLPNSISQNLSHKLDDKVSDTQATIID